GGDRIGVVGKAEIRRRVGGATAAGCVPGDDVVLMGQALQLGGSRSVRRSNRRAAAPEEPPPRRGGRQRSRRAARPAPWRLPPPQGHYARDSHERNGVSSDLPCRAPGVVTPPEPPRGRA